MVFSSSIFLFYFLPVVLLARWLVPARGWPAVLAVLSYAFYGWANPAFMALMFLSTGIDFLCGGIIERRRGSGAARVGLWVSILSNLGLLGFFKYFNFAAENYHRLLGTLGLQGQGVDFALEVTLPLGISFYTFQSMSYTIDVYRGHARAISSFPTFACYVSMFPQLVAGPIVRFRSVAAQLAWPDRSSANFARGTACFCLGLAKKILLANPCGKVADTVFAADAPATVDAWLGVVAYSFQIYFDFSAYSDMAIGLGLILGFAFPINFDGPYRARSITEFWRRWHISLSTWLRDYLYIPLGGNRMGDGRTYANLLFVMFVGGLWHGASWNFVWWGLMHGLLLAGERLFGGPLWGRLPGVLQVAATFLVVSLAWVPFRAVDFPSAVDYYARLFGIGEAGPAAVLVGGLIYQPLYLLAMGIAAWIAWDQPTTIQFTRVITWPKVVWVTVLLVVSCAMLSIQSFNPFIYFIF